LVQQAKDKKEAEERAKKEEAVAAAAAKKATDIAYKNSIKALIALCTESFKGTNFDRFWVEGNQRRHFNNLAKVTVCLDAIAEIKARSDLDQAGINAAFD